MVVAYKKCWKERAKGGSKSEERLQIIAFPHFNFSDEVNFSFFLLSNTQVVPHSPKNIAIFFYFFFWNSRALIQHLTINWRGWVIYQNEWGWKRRGGKRVEKVSIIKTLCVCASNPINIIIKCTACFAIFLSCLSLCLFSAK